MAGNGPAPAENRRRRNEPARGEWVDLDPLEKTVLPNLPRRTKDEGPWPKVTRDVWKSWQADPVTSQYSPADVAYALDTIRLHAGMTAKTAAEVRLRMDALGLTPKGKRDLRWRITDSNAEATSERASTSRSGKGSRRDRLTVVK